MINVKEFFQSYNKRSSTKRDIDAFMLLEKLAPTKDNIIALADDRKIYLSTNFSKLEQVATENDIKELVECGVKISITQDNDGKTISCCLYMYI